MRRKENVPDKKGYFDGFGGKFVPETLMHALEQNTPGQETMTSEALRLSLPLLTRRGTLIIISDFLDHTPAIFEALSPYLHKGFKVHLIQILAPDELKLESRGMLTFIDMETRQQVIANADTIRKDMATEPMNMMRM